LVEEDYRTVMPLPQRKKWGVDYIFQPVFTQQLGLFGNQSLGEEVTRRFILSIPPRFRYVDLCLNTYNQLPVMEGIRVRQRLTHELDLISGYEQIRKGYAGNTVRNLKKAAKEGVFVTPHGRPEALIDAFRRHRGRSLSYSEGDYQLLKHLIYSGLHTGRAQLYSAYSRENNFCAGLVFYRSHKKVVFLFSGSLPPARENGAMFLLFDRFIRDHAGQELVLDFEGSSDKNLARFYRGFGSKECVFLQISINRSPRLLKPFVHWYTWLRQRGFPGG